jgi:DNA-binding protein HU-beta
MTQADLAAKLATEHGITKTKAAEIIEGLGKTLQKDLIQNGKTSCFGLGKLVVVERTGRNPQTGDPVRIPAKKVVKFKPSNALKKVVNE